DGKKFVFTALQVSGNPVQEKILSIFKEDLAAAGIDMKIATLEWPVYIGKLDKHDYEVCSLGWQMPFESDPYQVWHSSQAEIPGGSNHIGFVNKKADKLIEDIRTALDSKKRIELSKEFHQLIHEEQPYTFLVVPESLQLISGKLSNVECFPLGMNSSCFAVEP
ncbi:MAG: peptide-binding protein, partial [Lentisphaeria bacterium]|nr:peptide-binding protein [Lentisphaeria bacterium]